MNVDPNRPLDPPASHIKARTGLRTIGVLLLVVGGIVLLVGLSEFVMAFVNAGKFGGGEASPGRMILMMPGLLMVGIGGQMCLAGWAGRIAEYGVREGSAAAAEGVNRVGLGARRGIEAMSGAVAAGIREGASGRVACAACGDMNDSDARFCDACGAAVSAPCGACGAVNEPDARFCDQCGVQVST